MTDLQSTPQWGWRCANSVNLNRGTTDRQAVEARALRAAQSTHVPVYLYTSSGDLWRCVAAVHPDGTIETEDESEPAP